MSSFDYEYDLDGLRTSVVLPGGASIEYSYDGLNRLVDEHKKNSSGQTIWQREYEYDKVGNRTKLIKDDGSGGVTYDYSYNGLGQLTKVEWTVGTTEYEKTYSYDANGNLGSDGRSSFSPFLPYPYPRLCSCVTGGTLE